MEPAGQQTYSIFHGPSLAAPYAAAVVEFEPAFRMALPIASIRKVLEALLPREIELAIPWPDGPLMVAELAGLIANAFQDLRGANGFPHEVSQLGEARMRVAVGFLDADAAIMALRGGLGLAHAIFSEATKASKVDRKKLAAFLTQSTTMAGYQPDHVARALIRASRRRGVPVIPLVSGTGMWLYGEGARGWQLAEASSHRDSQVGLRLSRDKFRTAEFLGSLGLPTVEHLPATSPQQAIQIARRLGYPVVVKPVRGSRGQGVSVGVKDDEGVAIAFAKARAFTDDPILVERLVPGNDYRLSVFGGKLLRASRFDPPHVVGDGKTDISGLIEVENANRDQGDIAAGLIIRISANSEMVESLREQGLGLSDVPRAGRRVLLRRNANLATGGTLEEVTDHLHPDNRVMAETIARALHLDAVGIDFKTTDVSRSWREGNAAVIEVNATPGLGDVLAERVIAQKFKDDGRVPAVLVLESAAECSSLIAAQLSGRGLHVGETGPELTRLGDEQRFRSPAQLPVRIKALLLDPACEALVVRATPEEIEQHGLPYAKFGLVVIGASTTISEDLAKLLAAHVGRMLRVGAARDELVAAVDEIIAGIDTA